mmetsp:Transcript_22483/g.19977  ORF Transcript_22483/g.19977 Transcript_22483/m.19977 type:complete len:135 (+) Transcript_22483:230-634(+)
MHMLYSIYVSYPAQSCSAALGQTQLIMLLPEIGPYLPTLIRKVIYNLREVLVSFEFLGLHGTSFYQTLKKSLGYPTEASLRNWSIMLDGSSLMNLFNWIGGVFIFIFLYLVFFLLKGIIKEEHESKWWGKFIKK